MKRLFHDLIFTALFAGMLVLVMEVYIYKTPNELSYKDWYMTEKADKIKILLLGNSLFAQSFNPWVFGDSAFDGASAGRNMYYDIQILKKYAPRMRNLETVIFPVSIGMFGDSICSPMNQQPYALYMGIMAENNPFRYSSFFSGGFYLKDLNPRVVYPHLEEGKENSSRSMDSLGYITMFRQWDGHSIKNGIRHYDEFTEYGEVFVKQLTKLVEECDNLRVRLICVQPPSTNTIQSKTDLRLYRALDSVLFELCKTTNIEYKSYYNNPNFRNNSLYFDELHLNHSGATLFAQQVKEDFNL